MKTLALGLLLSPHDFYSGADRTRTCFPNWIRDNDVETIFDKVYINVDWPHNPNGDQSLNHVHTSINICKPCYDVQNIPLNHDFAASRNMIAGRNECDWLMMLDVDEIMYPRTKRKIRELINTPEAEQYKAFGFPTLNWVEDHFLEAYPDFHFRLVKKGMRWVNCGPTFGASPGCHEVPNTQNRLVTNLHLLHYKPENIRFRYKGYADKDSTHEHNMVYYNTHFKDKNLKNDISDKVDVKSVVFNMAAECESEEIFTPFVNQYEIMTKVVKQSLKVYNTL